MGMDRCAQQQCAAAVSVRGQHDVRLHSVPPLANADLHFARPEIISMAELQDNPELQRYSNAVLFVLAGNVPPAEQVEIILDNFVTAIKSSTVSLSPLYRVL